MHKTLAPAVAAALMTLATLAATSLVANAQPAPSAPSQSPDTSPPDTAQKPAGKPGDNSANEPLSKKLDKSEGVLKPPTGVDPGIHEKPPKTGDKMPVIVPPGEPGGDQSVQPK